MSSYDPVGWANDESHPLSEANMKTLDGGLVDAHNRLDGQPVKLLFETVLTTPTIAHSFGNSDIDGELADWEELELTVEGGNVSEGPSVFRKLSVRFNGAAGSDDYVSVLGSLDGDGTRNESFLTDRLMIGETGGTPSILRSVAFARITGHSRSDRRTVVVSSGHAQHGLVGANIRKIEASGSSVSNSVVTSIEVRSTTDNFAADTRITLLGKVLRT